MNEQLTKLAEKINKGADQLPAMYEALRGQYVIYSICNIISMVAFCFSVTSLIVAGFTYYKLKQNDFPDEYRPISKRVWKRCLMIGIPSVIIIIVCQVILYIYAIDIVALKQMVGGK